MKIKPEQLDSLAALLLAITVERAHHRLAGEAEIKQDRENRRSKFR
jgi:hypothetical protein